jgi:hypothetical protein
VDNPWLETDVVMISTKAGSTVRLSAAGTDAGDDEQNVKVTWWIYREVGTLEGATSSQINGLNNEVMLPPVKSPGTVPVILQSEDDGQKQSSAHARETSGVLYLTERVPSSGN